MLDLVRDGGSVAVDKEFRLHGRPIAGHPVAARQDQAAANRAAHQDSPGAGYAANGKRALRADEARARAHRQDSKIGTQMIVLGAILLIIGLLVGISLLTTVGGVLIVVGAVLWVLGTTGRKVGGRKHYF